MDKSGWVMGEVLARQARARGDRTFLTFPGGLELGYAEANAIANRVGRGVAALGAAPGDRVGVWLPNGPEILHASFGIYRAGAVAVFVNPGYRGSFLEHLLNDSGARWVILAGEYLPRLAESEARLPGIERAVVVGPVPPDAPRLRRIWIQSWEELVRQPADPLGVPVSYRDVGAMMYTSGTTGPSKGVLMPHGHLYLFGQGVVDNLRVTADDVYYICMPLFHANALCMQLYGTLIAGARAVIAPQFSASRWLDEVRASAATITNTLGVMTEFIHRQPERPEDRHHRLRLICAVPTPAEIGASFRQRFGVPLIEGYGMTEVNIPLYMPLDAPYRAGSCGRVYDRYFEVRVVDPETDEEVPRDSVGEIVVRPREPFGFMLGYNAMPDRTVEAWRNFWFHTGDAGRQDGDGYFYFVDRIKDTIRRRGENLSSYEIERVLIEHPAIAEAAAVAVRSEIAGGEDEVKVCVVLASGHALSPEMLLDFCQARMPHFAVPRYVEFLGALPKTPTAKVQKAVLRQSGITPATWDREAAGYRVRR
jgi:crotonobetaine/carnitine-CoA ligase